MASHDRETAQQLVPNQLGINYFDILPVEILVEIFSNVDTFQLIMLGKVCQRFRNASETQRLWQKVSLPKYLVPTNTLKIIFRDHKHKDIRELDLSHSLVELEYHSLCSKLNLTSHELSSIVINLETLNLSDVQYFYYRYSTRSSSNKQRVVINELGLLLFMLEYRTKKLIINHFSVFDSDYYFKCAFKKNRHLEAISLENLTASPEASFNHIFVWFHRLREFNLSKSNVTGQQLLELCDLPRNLEKFMLNNVCLPQGYLMMIFERIVESAPYLKYFGASLEYFKKPEVLAVLNSLQNLESLRLYHDEWDEAKCELENILVKLTNVKTVHFVTQSGEPLSQMQRREIQLQTAEFGNSLNARLSINTKVDVLNCGYKLHFHKLQQ